MSSFEFAAIIFASLGADRILQLGWGEYNHSSIVFIKICIWTCQHFSEARCNNAI